MSGELARALNEHGHDMEDAVVTASQLAGLIAAVQEGKVNLNTAKKVFLDAYQHAKDPIDVIAERGLEQVSDDSAIAAIVDKVLAENPKEVERYRAGEEKVFGFLIGQVMRATKGQAAPPVVQRVLKERLNA
jgi:aspartyl-tRNA(Asn)/glutamyl-tRNA(Gln) amidotransferase subunit B